MIDRIIFLEELAARAHPPLQTRLYDGWILGFSQGYTNRANSVIPLYPSHLPLKTKIAFCESQYTDQGLPTVFKLTDASPAELEPYLISRGYEKITPTRVMTLKIQSFAASCSPEVTLTRQISPLWLGHFLNLSELADPKTRSAASTLLKMIRQDCICAEISLDGQAIACGLGVLEQGHAGLFGITVAPPYRRQGYARKICRSLLSEAVRQGAHSSYLQVVATNTAAIHLYKELGYQHEYDYWYRVKRGGGHLAD